MAPDAVSPNLSNGTEGYDTYKVEQTVQRLCQRISELDSTTPLSQEVSMKAGWLVLASTAVLLALLGTEAEAGRTLRDFSGDAMQRL